MNPNEDNFDSWESAGLPNPELTRDEIKFIKQQVAQSQGGIYEATKRLQEPFTRHLARAHPQTHRLYRIWSLLGVFNLACITVFPLLLLIFTRWYWVPVPIILNFLVVQPIHNSINLELFARISLIHLKMEDEDFQLPPPQH